jgi:hypothetical protein
MKFEVLTSVTMKIGLFWNVKQCRLLNATSDGINILKVSSSNNLVEVFPETSVPAYQIIRLYIRTGKR